MTDVSLTNTKAVIVSNAPTTELRLKFSHSSTYTGPVNSNMYTLQQAFVAQEHSSDGIQLVKIWKDVPVVDVNGNPM